MLCLIYCNTRYNGVKKKFCLAGTSEQAIETKALLTECRLSYSLEKSGDGSGSDRGDYSQLVGKQEVCAEQRVVQEGSSPSGAQMRSAISKSGVRSLAGRRKRKVWRGLNGHEGESWTQPRPT